MLDYIFRLYFMIVFFLSYRILLHYIIVMFCCYIFGVMFCLIIQYNVILCYATLHYCNVFLFDLIVSYIP